MLTIKELNNQVEKYERVNTDRPLRNIQSSNHALQF